MAPMGTGRFLYVTFPLIVVVCLPAQPEHASSAARTGTAGPKRIAGNHPARRTLSIGFLSPLGGGPFRDCSYQSDPRGMPSSGQMAANQVVLLMDGDTTRTLPSHIPTRQPALLIAWTL